MATQTRILVLSVISVMPTSTGLLLHSVRIDFNVMNSWSITIIYQINPLEYYLLRF